MKITKFKLLKKCHQDNLKDKMTAVLGFYSHDSKGDLNYLTVFNEDLKALNRFVEIPPSGNDVENEYQQALADRDMAYERAQTRWQQSEQDLHVGVTFMKELIFYEQNLKEIQTKRAIHLERMSEIESYLTSDDQDLELKRWRKQGNLAFMNTADILAFKDRLDTLHVLLDLFESKKWGSDPVGIEITEVIKFNRQLLNHYYQQTIEAMLYRVEAATEFGNIYYDDAYNLLKRKMGMELTTAGHSYEMSPKKYSECIRYIKRSNLKNIKKRLTEILKKWEDNKEHRFPLKMIDHELVPLALFSDTRKAGPSQSSSDKYFKSDNGEIGYKPLLRKYLIGSYDNQALYINKALQQITWFNEQVSIWESKKQSISLEKLKYVMAFRWAIDVHDILKNEIARCDSARSSILLKASNLKHEQDRLNRWKVILENAKSEIESKCSNIARFVLKDYQTLLFYSMKNRTFILSRQSIDFLYKIFPALDLKKNHRPNSLER